MNAVQALEDQAASIAVHGTNRLATQESHHNCCADEAMRAVGILEKELVKNAGAFAQADTNNMKALAGALGAIVDASAFAAVGVNKEKLMALVQLQQGDDDDDLDMGAPATKVYESKGGSIVDVLADMKDKAEGGLSDLRKAQSNTAHNFNMLKQSLEDVVGELRQ